MRFQNRNYQNCLLAASLCLQLPVAFAAPPVPAAEPPTHAPFVDVPRDHWAYEAVEELRQRGILLGYPPAPERPATAPAPARRQVRPALPSSRRGSGRSERQAPRRR
jgi:S-layer homology domain